MNMQYPVPGYRNQAARAARTGFQSFEARYLAQPFRSPSSPTGRDLEALLQQAFRPNRPSTPVRTGPGRSIIPLVRAAGKVGGFVLTRHPIFRAAELAWKANRFLSQPVARSADQSDPVGQLVKLGFTICYTCEGAKTHQKTISLSGCSGACYNAQAQSGTQVVGSPIPEGRRMVYLNHYHSTDRWNIRAGLHRKAGPAIAAGWDTVPGVVVQLAPQSAPMPTPYSLIPHLPNTIHRTATYGDRLPPPAKPTKTIVQHRPPGKGVEERKFTLMSGGRLRNLIEGAFEATETVGILHNALPKECQVKGTVAQKFAAVYSCASSLDGCKVIEGFINNHIEDKIIGILGQAAKKSAQGTGKSYGLAGITKKLGKPYFDENGDLQFDPTLPFSIPTISLGC